MQAPSQAPRSTDQQLHEAVFNTRVARHHTECTCGQYRDAKGEAFCTPAEWRYNSMVDRLIDKALAATQPNTGHTDPETTHTVS